MGSTSKPRVFEREEQLDDFMTTPSGGLIDMMGRLRGGIAILGIGGKMGHTLGVQVKRAAEAAGVATKIIGVSRFSDAAQREKIEASGIETVACDLADPAAVEKLPDAENIVYMAGRKFGTGGTEALTWAMNTVVPANVIRRFRAGRIVVFSTGNVYPLVPIAAGGCAEDHRVGPVGEYAMSCLGRERVFEYAARTFGTKVAVVRLNYSVDLRYGVFHDIAASLAQHGTADVTVPAFNAIWQGDAVDHIVRAIEHCDSPPFVLNVTGPEILFTREVARLLARRLDVAVSFAGEAGDSALLNDASKAFSLFGYPSVTALDMIDWTAAWIRSGGRSLGKPTHFEVKTGEF